MISRRRLRLMNWKLIETRMNSNLGAPDYQINAAVAVTRFKGFVCHSSSDCFLNCSFVTLFYDKHSQTSRKVIVTETSQKQYPSFENEKNIAKTYHQPCFLFKYYLILILKQGKSFCHNQYPSMLLTPTFKMAKRFDIICKLIGTKDFFNLFSRLNGCLTYKTNHSLVVYFYNTETVVS